MAIVLVQSFHLNAKSASSSLLPTAVATPLLWNNSTRPNFEGVIKPLQSWMVLGKVKTKKLQSVLQGGEYHTVGDRYLRCRMVTTEVNKERALGRSVFLDPGKFPVTVLKHVPHVHSAPLPANMIKP